MGRLLEYRLHAKNAKSLDTNFTVFPLRTRCPHLLEVFIHFAFVDWQPDILTLSTIHSYQNQVLKPTTHKEQLERENEGLKADRPATGLSTKDTRLKDIREGVFRSTTNREHD